MVIEWKDGKKDMINDDLEIIIEGVTPSFDEKNKHVETLVKLRVNCE